MVSRLDTETFTEITDGKIGSDPILDNGNSITSANSAAHAAARYLAGHWVDALVNGHSNIATLFDDVDGVIEALAEWRDALNRQWPNR